MRGTSSSTSTQGWSQRDISETDRGEDARPHRGEEGEEEEEEEEEEDYDPYLFIHLLPELSPAAEAYCSQSQIPDKPADSPPITLVLDLDETLVHCSVEPMEGPDLTFPVSFGASEYTVNARVRPHFKTFLERAAGRFEIVVFTASQEVYATKILDIIDPEHRIKYRLFRNTCINVYGNYLKHLAVLGRDLRKTVIVDNSPTAFGYHLDNGIPIESWFDDPNDTELLKLWDFLESLNDPSVTDVRPLVRNTYKLHEMVARAGDGVDVALETEKLKRFMEG
eukprot:TRINITY_DN6661_c0_g1_i1.p1 TRINITY_DN6661_c0_g1~~TRINITY_DN6661_c0_g1_i1.p1  ORF type:complete len:280 (-),score=75.13 TRINITY_DN6661_c0_g1_i1:8-847(-)